MRTIYHEDGDNILIEYKDDIEPHLKLAHELAAMKSRSERIGDWHHAMKVPNVIMMKIMNDTGLNFFDQGDWPEIWKILKRDYPMLKTTPHNL